MNEETMESNTAATYGTGTVRITHGETRGETVERTKAPATAYLLVTHGSRDRRPQEAMDTVTQRLQQLRSGPPLLVAHAVLELGPTPLRSQILDFVAQQNLPRGSCLRILPLFLLAGIHVMEDIPEEVASAQEQLGDRIELEVIPYFGASTDALAVLLRQGKQQFMAPMPEHWILMAHGSRRSQAVASVEALAERLNFKTAYWVQKESLRHRIEEFRAEMPNVERLTIGILPCFLFEGGLTDAIARQILELGLQFPQVELRLGPTLGSLPGFVEQIQSTLTQCNVHPES